jgi:prephenate dehydratase
MIAMRRSSAQLSPARERSDDRIHVAFQGELGAYGDQAIAQCWHGSAVPAPSASFEHVVADVAWSIADFGILPVWNSVVGEIAAGCAAVRLARSTPYGLVVIGDAHVVVRHHLLALPGSRMDDIRSVTSHPVALAQCGRFLAAHPKIAPTPGYDTAGAARDLARDLVTRETRDAAAIAGRIAAERYRLVILEADIQDVPDNVTHFLILAHPAHDSSTSRMPRASGLAGEVARW